MSFNISVLSDYDHRYVRSKNIELLPAFRVEQGEYVSTSINNAIGTYNVQQCVILYIRDTKNAVHGLAHVDGHTEINSLSPFLESFTFNSDIKAKIFRNSKSDVSGLNDPYFNFHKVQSLLSSIEHEVVDENFPDFVIDSEGNRIKGLPFDAKNLECRALHIAQQAKRSLGYLGTYRIIQSCSDQYTDIILDQRAFFILNQYSNTPEDFERDESLSLGGGVLEGNQAFIESLRYLDNIRNSSYVILKRCFSLFELTLRHNIPITIPENSDCNKNAELLSCFPKEGEWCSAKLPSNGTMEHAINIACKYDSKLDTNAILQYLSAAVGIDAHYISGYQYDTVISAQQFNFALRESGSSLYGYVVINSKGHLSFPAHTIHLEVALESIKLLPSKNVLDQAARCFISEHNTEVESRITEISLERYTKSLHSVVLRAHNELKDYLKDKQINRVKVLASQAKTIEGFFETIKDTIFTSTSPANEEESFKNFQSFITKKLKELAHEKLVSELYTPDVPYRVLQNDFLKFIKHLNLKAFDELTIPKTMAFAGYNIQQADAPNYIAFIEQILNYSSPECDMLLEQVKLAYIRSLLVAYISSFDSLLETAAPDAICFNLESTYIVAESHKYYLTFDFSKDAGDLFANLQKLYPDIHIWDKGLSDSNPEQFNVLELDGYCWLLI